MTVTLVVSALVLSAAFIGGETRLGAEGPLGANPPNPPHSISFSEKRPTKFTVNWQPGAHIVGQPALTGFGLMRHNVDTPWPPDSHAVVRGPNDPKYTFTGLDPSTAYEIRIRACNGKNSCSGWAKGTVTTAAAGPPTGKHTISVDQVTATTARLKWSPDADTGGGSITGFDIMWRVKDTSWTTDGEEARAGATDRRYPMTGLADGTTYEVRIRTCNNVPSCSGWSGVAEFTTASTRPAAPAPGNLTAGTVTDTSVPLSWDVVANTTKYWVQYRESGTTDWTTDNDGLTSTSHTVDELDCETTYRFRASAYGDGTTYAATWGAWTGNTSATTSECPPGTIAAPGKVGIPTFPQPTSRGFTVSWNQPSNSGPTITYYEVFRDPPGGAADRVDNDPPTTSKSYSGLMPYTTYRVKVRACNNASDEDERCGDWSPYRSVRTKSSLSKPQNLNVKPAAGPRAHMTWQAVSSASYYEVEYRPLQPAINGRQAANAGWIQLHRPNVRPIDRVDISHSLKLPNFHETSSEHKIGFDDHEAYELRVQAVKESSVGGKLHIDKGPYSAPIAIIDTPITHVNGDSRNLSAGTAKISWNSIHDIFGSYYSEAKSTIKLRYREALPGHNTASWDIGQLTTPTSPAKVEISGIRADISSFQHGSNDQLTRKKLYAIQFVYEARRFVGDTEFQADRITAYAVRDAFVWPADDPPMHGSRVGTFSMNVNKGNRTRHMNICKATFDSDGRSSSWESVIRKGFGHWQSALPMGLMEYSLTVGTCTNYYTGENPGEMGVAEAVSAAVIAALDAASVVDVTQLDSGARGEIAERVNDVRSRMVNEIIMKNKEDREKNEIIMYDDVGVVLTALRQSVFHQMANDIGHHAGCWYEDVEEGLYAKADLLARACTVFNSHPTIANSYTSDVFVRRSAFRDKPLDIPAEGTGSFCRDGQAGDFSAFAVMVHEIGHVLGIGGGSPGPKESSAGHPGAGIQATVMAKSLPEGTCGVHPLDKMAIMALYQAVVAGS